MLSDVSSARTSPCCERCGCIPGLQIFDPPSRPITQPPTRRSYLETTTPVLFARTPGPSEAQSTSSNLPRAAIVAPVILAALAVLVLVGLGYSRCRRAVSAIPSPILLHCINHLEEPTMWDVHVASGGGWSAAVEADRRVFTGK
ncbi:hypothetical protein V8D89_003104 [Ganoderma adspersum]